jgi:TetR/AcrR family transcriptional regulator, regulator of autoinduction and epiphytic fitness
MGFFFELIGLCCKRTVLSSYNIGMNKPSFRAQVLRAREDAIVDAVNHLLADKGFDAMTVDEVAAEVGIAKASLYKHFESKEALAAAAMVRVLARAQAFCDHEAAALPQPLARLQAVARWTMQVQWAGEMPSLPAQNSTLRGALVANRDYMDRLMALSDRLGEWIEAAQAEGALSPDIPAEVVLYTLFSRACDPVLSVLKAGGNYTEARAIDCLMRTCFQGLAAR